MPIATLQNLGAESGAVMDTYRVSVSIDGKDVGPVFDLWEEDAHDWVAQHHPGEPYTITVASDGRPDLVVGYPAR
jgi:esterase/lipase superfamily enzyme